MKKRRKVIVRVALIVGISALVSVLGITVAAVFSYNLVDSRADSMLFDKSRKYSSTVFYCNETPYSDTYTPVECEISGNVKKLYYSLDEISPYLKDGFIAVEDRQFYEHGGIDIKRTLAAAVNYVIRTEKIYGASTITQQVVKNISGDSEATLTRKLAEIIRARRIERRYSKDDILEVYLNVIPMSENIYGVGYAARAYFGKEPSELSAAEAATLIGITNAPTAYNPYNNPDACKKKRDTVLSVMLSEGVIDELEYTEARDSEITLLPREQRDDGYNSWFAETVIDEASLLICEKYSISERAARIMLSGGGYSIYTTMDIDVQSALREYFENEENLSSDFGLGLEYAMTVIDSQNGNLLGIIGRGGKKTGNLLLNHATVPHIPASALKPLALYAPLLDEGKINWATVFDDVPVSFWESEGEYREYPHNSPNVYDGLVNVKDAVRLSKNTVAVRLCKMKTPVGVYNFLTRELGFNTLIGKGGENGVTDIALSPMALGQLSQGVPLISLTSAYASFPSDGILHKTRSFVKIVDYNGNTVIENRPSEKRVFKTETARIMNMLLSGVTEDGTARSITLKEMVSCAGKTGTSSSNRDKLFVGYTPYYTAGIWCGAEREGVSASSGGHLEIWDNVMKIIHEKRLAVTEYPKEFSTEGLLYLPYCKDSGRAYTEECQYDKRGVRLEYGYFTPDNRPQGECDRHIKCTTVDDEGNFAYSSLLRLPERSFPKEIPVTDETYSYNRIFEKEEQDEEKTAQ